MTSPPSPFALFAGSDYYPIGGWEDFRGCHRTIEVAIESLGSNERDWAHVVDLRTLSIVARADDGVEWTRE